MISKQSKQKFLVFLSVAVVFAVLIVSSKNFDSQTVNVRTENRLKDRETHGSVRAAHGQDYKSMKPEKKAFWKKKKKVDRYSYSSVVPEVNQAPEVSLEQLPSNVVGAKSKAYRGQSIVDITLANQNKAKLQLGLNSNTEFEKGMGPRKKILLPIFMNKTQRTTADLSVQPIETSLETQEAVTNINITVNLTKTADSVSLNKTRQKLCPRQLPEVLIIGAPKCGTAALATFLHFHPNITTKPGRELNFFSDNFERGFKWYQQQMTCARPGQLTLERSSNYFHSSGMPERVWMLSGQTKLILTVCEPTRRVISHYSMMRALGKTNMSFSEAVFNFSGAQLTLNQDTYMIAASRYSDYLPAWLKMFPSKQIHIVDGDNLSKQPYQELSTIEQFLGIQKHFKQNDFILNETKGFFCYSQSSDSGKVQLKSDIKRRSLADSAISNEKLAKKQEQFLFENSDLFKREQIRNSTVKVNSFVTSADGPYCLSSGKGRKHVEVPDILVEILRQYFKPYNEKFYKISKRTFNW